MKKILFFIFILFSFIGCEKELEIYTGSKSDGRLSGVFSVSSNKKVYLIATYKYFGISIGKSTLWINSVLVIISGFFFVFGNNFVTFALCECAW